MKNLKQLGYSESVPVSLTLSGMRSPVPCLSTHFLTLSIQLVYLRLFFFVVAVVNGPDRPGYAYIIFLELLVYHNPNVGFYHKLGSIVPYVDP